MLSFSWPLRGRTHITTMKTKKQTNKQKKKKWAGIRHKEQNCADWNRSGWKLISSSVSDGEEKQRAQQQQQQKNTHTHKHLSQAACRKQNCAIKKNIIGLSFLFVCHGGSRKLQLREELRATLLSPLQKRRGSRHRTFTYSFTAFEIQPFSFFLLLFLFN